ncbi:hypothetical protein [Actinomadura livida]|uniref:Uncharacterized protein n=1 Tax=Actinomadura livida TaxID=79909 RepID=A0A7W7IG66_9ACTN|nr:MULTISPECIES: hypothetical protein [Actinomadura]MBB4776395.1 hypothetical protein [Actinomadura catellatispora]
MDVVIIQEPLGQVQDPVVDGQQADRGTRKGKRVDRLRISEGERYTQILFRSEVIRR